MATEIIGMFGSISGGTQDAIASIDIPQDGAVTGIDWAMNCDLDADGEEVQAEVSFIATNQISANDVRGRISSIATRAAFVTSGFAIGSVNKFVGPMDLPVAGGERLHLHAVSTAGVTGTLHCNIHLDVSRSGTRRSARR